MVETWDETTPPGTGAAGAISLGDDRIRELKRALRERLAVDHEFYADESGQNVGIHTKVTLKEAADIGTGASGLPILGAQTADSKPELTYTNEDDTDIQLTKGDKIHLDSGRLSNNTAIKARNAANAADLDLIKLNASDVPEILAGAVLSSDAAPTTDAGIANKKYVDDNKGSVVTYGVAVGSTDISTSSDTYVDMTGMEVILSGAGDYLCMFTAPVYASATEDGRIQLEYDGTGTGSLAYVPAHASSFTASFVYPVTLGAGEHTFKVQWKRGSGTINQSGSTRGKRVFTVVKVA